MEKYYSNLKRYDARMKRIAIFGRLIEDKIEIFELRCSKKDHFNKKLAKQVYEQYLTDGSTVCEECEYHPVIYLIIPENPEKPKWSFLRYVNEKFFRLFITVFRYEVGTTVKLNKGERYVEFQTLVGDGKEIAIDHE